MDAPSRPPRLLAATPTAAALQRAAVLLAAIGLAVVAIAGAPTTASAVPFEAAPGRVLFDVDSGQAFLKQAVALPDGGALLAGTAPGSGHVYLVKVTSAGLPDNSFGADGVADVDAKLAFDQFLLQADGSILLVGRVSPKGFLGPLPYLEKHLPLAVVRLDPDGTLDRSYGNDGTAQAGIEGGCQCDNVAVLGAGDTLTLTGQQTTKVTHPWGTQNSFHWALARLTDSGAPDPSFGTGGIALVPGEGGVGLSLDAAPGGTLIAQGEAEYSEKDPVGGTTEGATNEMTRITPTGAVDPGFGGGKPVRLPVYGLGDTSEDDPYPLADVVEPDGRVVVETFPLPSNPGLPRKDGAFGLVGYSSAGEIDKSYGYDDGYVNFQESREPLGSQLVSEPGGSVLAVHRRGSTKPSNNIHAVPGSIEFERITPAGQLDPSLPPPGLAVSVPFGGGLGEPLPSLSSYPEASFTLTQNTFLGRDSSAEAVMLGGGAVLLAGNVKLTATRPGRGPEPQTNRFAIALLTPAFSLNQAGGAPARGASLGVSAPSQRARLDAAERRILVRLRSSAPGLAFVSVRVGRRTLAHRLVALLAGGSAIAQVPLSKRARGYVSHHRRAQLTISAAFRDLLEQAASASAPLRLH